MESNASLSNVLADGSSVYGLPVLMPRVLARTVLAPILFCHIYRQGSNQFQAIRSMGSQKKDERTRLQWQVLPGLDLCPGIQRVTGLLTSQACVGVDLVRGGGSGQ